MLIASDGGAEVQGEFLIDDLGHRFGEWGAAVKDGELVRCEWGTDVVHGDGLKNPVVSWVALAVSGLDFRLVVLDGIGNVGGDDETVGGRIGDEDPVIAGGEG